MAPVKLLFACELIPKLERDTPMKPVAAETQEL
nr:unnamed protein product [Digitaria exilis]